MTKNHWLLLGQSFENVGDSLRIECENMSENCKYDKRFEQLYTNYVQLLESIKSQRTVIANRFDDLDLDEL